jgi:transcription elongation GreA/GreB family factor
MMMSAAAILAILAATTAHKESATQRRCESVWHSSVSSLQHDHPRADLHALVGSDDVDIAQADAAEAAQVPAPTACNLILSTINESVSLSVRDRTHSSAVLKENTKSI